ncbi:MAG: MCD, Malonyl-CoA decarboxylase MCD, partial [Alphaproteobacteria bacterium]|nr:MCD, Malonyl-CoA decarboxylase MCD [Alphaproteobacteria bacterium]
MPNSILADLLASVTEKGCAFLGLGEPEKDPARQAASLVSLCEQVLSGRGEASGAALAREVLDRYAMLDADARATFFTALAEKFGPDQAVLKKSVEEWTQTPGPEQAARLHVAAEARRQELFRRLNRAPGGTAALVDMREKLIDAANGRAELKGVDQDFTHLFSSWFNRGFLVLRRIDWSSPANVLEKIIRYEAVHEIRDWDDLRRRIDPPDRRCYAFFHPALVDEPLIFVEVALTKDIPAAIQPLLASE